MVNLSSVEHDSNHEVDVEFDSGSRSPLRSDHELTLDEGQTKPPKVRLKSTRPA
jgi:hypothetical protein